MTFRHALLTSSALSAAGLLAVNAAVAAEKPTLKISGYQDTYFGLADVDDGTTASGTPTYDGGITDGAFNVLQYGEIRFTVTGTTDNGMKWGVYFEDVQNDADTDGNKKSTDEANIWLEGSWGKLEIGGQDGAGDKIQIDATELSLYDTRMTAVFADTRGDNLRGSNDQITVRDTTDQSKFTYYTPRVSGFQAGASYVPSLGTQGSVPSGSTSGGFESGLSYKGKTGDVKYELAGVYIRRGEDGTGDTADGWGIGGVANFGAISVSGGYSQNNNSRTDASEQTGWTASANYHAGKWEVTLLYIENQLELDSGGPKDEYQEVSLQGAYALGGGLTVAGGIIQFENDAATPANGNDGTVALGRINARF